MKNLKEHYKHIITQRILNEISVSGRMRAAQKRGNSPIVAGVKAILGNIQNRGIRGAINPKGFAKKALGNLSKYAPFGPKAMYPADVGGDIGFLVPKEIEMPVRPRGSGKDGVDSWLGKLENIAGTRARLAKILKTRLPDEDPNIYPPRDRAVDRSSLYHIAHGVFPGGHRTERNPFPGYVPPENDSARPR